MKQWSNQLKSHPMLWGGLIFLTVSLVLNLISIVWLDMAHIYDVVHILPIVGFITLFPEITSSLALLPIAVVVDGIMGIIAGKLLSKFTKNNTSYLFCISIAFLVYYIAICYQWILII